MISGEGAMAPEALPDERGAAPPVIAQQSLSVIARERSERGNPEPSATAMPGSQ